MSLQILDKRAEPLGVVVDHAEGNVAPLAEQPANAPAADLPFCPVGAPALVAARAAGVVVVDHEPQAEYTVARFGDAPARLAPAVLLGNHPAPVRETDSVEHPELRVERLLGFAVAVRRDLLRRARAAVPARGLACVRTALAYSVDHVSAATGARFRCHWLSLHGPREFGGTL